MKASEAVIQRAIQVKLANAPCTLPELRKVIAMDLADDNRLADTDGETIGSLVERIAAHMCRDGTICQHDGTYRLTSNPGRPSWSA